MLQFMVESCAILAMRQTLGDKQTAEILFDQDYDPDFVSRHSHQLGALLAALSEDTNGK